MENNAVSYANQYTYNHGHIYLHVDIYPDIFSEQQVYVVFTGRRPHEICQVLE